MGYHEHKSSLLKVKKRYIIFNDEYLYFPCKHGKETSAINMIHRISAESSLRIPHCPWTRIGARQYRSDESYWNMIQIKQVAINLLLNVSLSRMRPKYNVHRVQHCSKAIGIFCCIVDGGYRNSLYQFTILRLLLWGVLVWPLMHNGTT